MTNSPNPEWELAPVEHKPVAVAGGLWDTERDIVKVWDALGSNPDNGGWSEHPMVHCQNCGGENHLELCLDCAEPIYLSGRFKRICVICDNIFSTDSNWKIRCSRRCRQATLSP